MPARRVIALENTGGRTWRVAYWMDVVEPLRRPFWAARATPTKVLNASQQEKDDIEAGLVVERIETHTFPVGTGVAAIKQQLVDNWTARQAEIDADNPWARYGTHYTDGDVWVDVVIP